MISISGDEPISDEKSRTLKPKKWDRSRRASNLDKGS